jgi:hypothetical protein
MLPSDFSGPPAAAVTGNVLPGLVGGTPEAAHPRLSLEWLSADSALALIPQPLSFQRSSRLQHDWDIGLALPADSVKFDADVGPRTVRMGVAKMVYFDDRNQNDAIDWSCRGPQCDRVLAFSDQYVVFVDKPQFCDPAAGTQPKTRLQPGYHYFSVSNGVLREMSSSDSLSFTLIDRAPADSDPTEALLSFAQGLVRIWQLGGLTGC